MAYVRLGPDSDICLLGVRDHAGKHYIQCWGCLFTPPETATLDEPETGQIAWDNFPMFDSRAETITHVLAHVQAGHEVPPGIVGILGEIQWLGE